MDSGRVRAKAEPSPAVTAERVPPQDPAAEAAVLGSMLLDNSAIPIVSDIIIREEEFYKPENRIIYRAILELYERNKVCDIVMLRDWVAKQGPPAGDIPVEYLITLVDSVPSAANARYYAEIVRNLAVARNLISVCNEISAQAYDPTSKVEELLDTAERRILDVTLRHDSGDPQSLESLLEATFYNAERAQQGRITGLRTGFIDLDNLTAGLQAAQFIVIAGRPSMGKTSLALNIAEHVALAEGKPVLIISLEMTKEELTRNLLCSHCRVDAHKMRRGILPERDWNKLVHSAGELAEAPLFIDDTPGLTIEEIRRKCRRMKASVRDLALIMVDYLQLVQVRSMGSRQQEVAYISAGLKNLARELQIPVIALSQLSRAPESEKRDGHRPMLSDLRESGAIEQDADVVILIYRPEFYQPEQHPGKAELIIAKQRTGPAGEVVVLTFLKNYMRFENRAANVQEREI